MAVLYFQWQDYSVLGVMLGLSAAVGFYYACTGGKQKTTNEYLLGNKNMHWFPVGCSLLASFVSSQTLIGLPGEIYTFGTILLLGYAIKPIGVVIASTLYIPVFRNLQMISVYQYIEMRFGRNLKYMVVIAGILNMILYTALVLYAPALSISAVTGLNLWLAVLTVALVAMVYTVLGGLKAILWTDTLQLLMMIAGVLLVLALGVIKEGGFDQVWEASRLSGRLDMLEPKKFLDFDPRMRHTLWGVAAYSLIEMTSSYGYNQTSVQRATSLKSSKDVVLGYLLAAVGSVLFGIWCGLLGLVIFATNKLCDPVSEGTLDSKDQLYPLFVMKLLHQYPGLPGLILSSIFSASLSTVSSMLNSVAAILLQDFVKPCKPNLSDKHATIITKVMSLVLGAINILLVLFARYFGSGLMSMGMTFTGIFSGPAFAVFTMGIFMPVVNQKGAIIGFLCGSLFAAWVGFGSLVNSPYIYEYPTSTAGCNITDPDVLANMSSPVYDPNTWDPHSHYRTGVNALYDVSYIWSAAIGFLITVITSIISSLILAREDDPAVESNLLSPVVIKSCCLMPRSWRDKIRVVGETQQDDEVEMQESDLLTAKEGIHFKRI